jgi:hypothetical protein
MARPSYVEVGIIRDYGAPGLEQLAIAKRSVADIRSAWLDLELFRTQAHRLSVREREDLTAAPVDHRHRAGLPGRKRVERGDPRDWDAKGEGERAGRHESHAQARVATGPGSDDDAPEVSLAKPRPGEQALRVLEDLDRARAPLPEHIAVAGKGTSGHVRGRVKR